MIFFRPSSQSPVLDSSLQNPCGRSAPGNKGFRFGAKTFQIPARAIAHVADDFRFINIQPGCNATGKSSHRTITASAIAARAACDQVSFAVRPALRMGLDVIQGKSCAGFDRRTTVRAGHSIAQVDRQSFVLANPVHSLPVAPASGIILLYCCFLDHTNTIHCVVPQCKR